MTEYNKLLANNWYATASESDRRDFREWISAQLAAHNCVTVTFVKADSTTRVMPCTLKAGICPTVETVKVSDTVCPVWATDVAAWRSFKFENVRRVDFEV